MCSIHTNLSLLYVFIPAINFFFVFYTIYYNVIHPVLHSLLPSIDPVLEHDLVTKAHFSLLFLSGSLLYIFLITPFLAWSILFILQARLKKLIPTTFILSYHTRIHAMSVFHYYRVRLALIFNQSIMFLYNIFQDQRYTQNDCIYNRNTKTM